jgi:hypothetical protein
VAQEGLGPDTIASYSVAIPAAMIANTSCKLGKADFRNPRQLSTFTDSRAEPFYLARPGKHAIVTSAKAGSILLASSPA